MTQTLLVCGDPQAESLFLALQRIPAIADRFQLRYYDPGRMAEETLKQTLPDCSIIFEQHSERPPLDRASLPPSCVRVTFPRLTFKLLWPFTCVNSYNEPDPPEFPAGRFPYGNAVVLEYLHSDLSKEQILSAVLGTRWESHWPNLEDALALETGRLTALSSTCDVHVEDFILGTFRERRLFWAVDLPSNALLEVLLGRLIGAGVDTAIKVSAAEIAEAFESLGSRDVLAVTTVPIHPHVAEHFGLAWYDPEERHRLYDESMVSYTEYFERMIDESVRVRDARKPALKLGDRYVVIVFGNCQADALALTLSKLRGRIGGLHVLYLPSYDKPGGYTPLNEDDVRACDVLLEQQDPQQFPLRHLLPPDCQRIKFPSLDLNLLWPLGCINPYNHPEPPAYPQGRFPYGNALVVNGIDHGLSRDEMLRSALSETWEESWPNLDRLLVIETARLTARDKQCSVKMAPFILERFRTHRLFWAVNHPTNLLFAQLCSELISVALGHAIASAVSIKEVLAGMGTRDLLGSVGVPIHPFVAEHFGLTWYNPHERYPLFSDPPVTYAQYFESMIDTSLEAARQSAVGAASSGS